jgi:geranylgeranyl diphosphate synthase type I
MSAEDVRLVRDAMVATGVRDDVERMIADHVERAADAVATDLLAPAGVAGLVDLSRRLAWRSA